MFKISKMMMLSRTWCTKKFFKGTTKLHLFCIHIPKQFFTHSQLYAAFSRVTIKDGLWVMVNIEDIKNDGVVKKIFYEEIF